MVQKQVDIIYDSFLTKVAEGREMEYEAVKELAGGRVWSGADALELGLVDEIGGLRDAILYASEQVNLGSDPAIKELPEATDFLQELMKELSQANVSAVKGTPFEPFTSLYGELSQYASQFNDPTGVYAILPYSVNVE